jgi:regulator of sirC expression with transglutaminase-like and TPR domain
VNGEGDGSGDGQDPERQALLDLLGRRSSAMELDRAALEIARLEYPDLDAAAYIRLLDDYASAIADRARDLSDGERFVETANAWLFGELGFQGNQDDYYKADNSYLNRVLDTRVGIPISLSMVYIEVARRLAKPVFGIGLPYHFLIRYDDGQYSTYIDPFHGGALLDQEGCCRLVQAESLAPEDLAPVSKRSMAMRVINNLRQVHFSRRDPERALRLLDLLIASDPASVDEHKQRAVALVQLRRMGPAIASFRRYLELAPEAPDRGLVEEQLHNIALWLASRN